MKIRPVGAEFHAGGRTDMTKLVVAFYNFGNAPEKYSSLNLLSNWCSGLVCTHLTHGPHVRRVRENL